MADVVTGHQQDADVNAWLLRASCRQLSLLMGVLVCPVLVLLFRFAGDRSWTAALLIGGAVALVCAPVLGALVASQLEQSVAAGAAVGGAGAAQAERAARRGPVPDDEAVRAAALQIVADRLTVLTATRARALLSTTVLLLVTGLTAVLRSPWWWGGTATLAVALVVVLIAPGRLRRRAALLRSTAP